jgi:hypothetical protein
MRFENLGENTVLLVMDIYKKVEIQRVFDKTEEEGPCRICKSLHVYLLFAVPTIALFWSGVDFGISGIDAQDLAVKVVLLILFFSTLRRVNLDFFRSG